MVPALKALSLSAWNTAHASRQVPEPGLTTEAALVTSYASIWIISLVHTASCLKTSCPTAL